MRLSFRTTAFVFAAVVGILVYLQYGIVHANPDQILENAVGSSVGSASSSPAYIGFGTATSTNSFDTQGDGALPAKSATLFVALTGSSSATTLNITLEFSQNNSDWYGDDISGVLGTSTQTITLTTPSKYTMLAATSSTIATGIESTPKNTVYRAFTVQVPSRYVRAIFSMSSSTVLSAGPNQQGTNGAVWSDFIAKKEIR